MATLLSTMFQRGSLPALETGIAQASARHRLILENLANADTPGYQRQDLDPRAFREAFRRAVEMGEGPGGGPPAERTQGEDLFQRSGMLRHDRNDVSLEMEMALLGRNATLHNQLAALLRKSFESIRMAISERVSAG